MSFKKIVSAFLLTYSWQVKTIGTREQLINFFRRKINSDSSVTGKTLWKTIYFTRPTISTIHSVSLIGFEVVIEEIEEHRAILHINAFFVQPFLFFYIISALLFPIFYIFDVQGAKENLDFFNNIYLNVVIPPALIWTCTMLYYQLKIVHGKDFIERSIAEFENNTPKDNE